MKKLWRGLLLFALIFTLAACQGQEEEKEPEVKVQQEVVVEEAEEEPKEEVTGDAKNIWVLIPGDEKDNGFMEAGYRGYERIRDGLEGVEVEYVSNISATSEEEALTEAMRDIAKEGPDLIIAQGGQNNLPAEKISAEFPEIQFIVIQGNVKGENLGSYAVDQEQSAYLAGALAGLMTETNKVGHLSGAWPQPGLNARAAYYQGLMNTNPEAIFYSTFTGNLDDVEINKEAANAQLEEGVDVIYTMLNGGRQGATDAIKKMEGNMEIGNVIDWTKEDDVFIGSAVADSSVAIFNAAEDFVNGELKTNEVTIIGLDNPEVVNITFSDSVAQDIKDQVELLKEQIMEGGITISHEFDGEEFDTETGEFVPQDAKDNR